jgi:hypothetical protein
VRRTGVNTTRRQRLRQTALVRRSPRAATAAVAEAASAAVPASASASASAAGAATAAAAVAAAPHSCCDCLSCWRCCRRSLRRRTAGKVRNTGLEHRAVPARTMLADRCSRLQVNGSRQPFAWALRTGTQRSSAVVVSRQALPRHALAQRCLWFRRVQQTIVLMRSAR